VSRPPQFGRLGQGVSVWDETDQGGRFGLRNLPDKPIKLMVFIHRSASGGRIHYPAETRTRLNQLDIRIVLDPTLARRSTGFSREFRLKAVLRNGGKTWMPPKARRRQKNERTLRGRRRQRRCAPPKKETRR
jgi:hypothetical protein